MNFFQKLKLDSILLPIVGVIICLGLWTAIAGKATTKTTTKDDGFGDMITVTETTRHGVAKNLPAPIETWTSSKQYVLEPFAKRGELDQGILRFAWLSLTAAR